MLKESLNCLEHIFSQNLDFGDAASEGSDGNEEHVIGNWRKGNPCHKVILNLAGLYCVLVFWER